MPMDREQHLLLKLMEEAAEVAHIASKTIQFGFDEVRPGQNQTNGERLCDEIQDFDTIVDMLNAECKLGFKKDYIKAIKKQGKVAKYSMLSEELGRLEQ